MTNIKLGLDGPRAQEKSVNNCPKSFTALGGINEKVKWVLMWAGLAIFKPRNLFFTPCHIFSQSDTMK